MNKRINLANKPFTNRVLPWAVTSILVVFSLITLVFMVRRTSAATAEATLVQNQITSLNQDKELLTKRAEAVQQALSPEQLQVLKSAHELVDRKRFSWTRLLGDLESVLPKDVRVARIAVRHIATTGGNTVADLDLTVIAKTPTIVTDMIADMDRGGIFQAELRSQSLQKGRGETGAEYELGVQYSPHTSFTASMDTGARASVEHSPVNSTGGPQ